MKHPRPALRAALVTLCAATGIAHADSYTPEAIATLRFMIEEEKLAGDLYETFSGLYPLAQYPSAKPFGNIMKSEDAHVAALLTQADLVGVDVSDLTAMAKGQFVSQAAQTLYDGLLARGSVSSQAALEVGRDIEVRDIADLDAAMAAVPADSSLHAAYGQLQWASGNHLNAFERHLAMAAPVPEAESYALMLVGLGLMAGITRRRRRA